MFTIRCRDSEESFKCLEGQTVLQAMEQEGRAVIAVGCRGGGCGVCKIRVTKGKTLCKKMSRKRVSEKEESIGFVLACRAYPEEDIEFEYYKE